jgi:hypothetical protein
MPGFQYYFYPFQSKNDPTLSVVGEKYRAKRNAEEITSDSQLADLDIRATLLIDGHSDEGSHEISARKGGSPEKPTWETITVDALAGRLARLPQQFVSIKMLACKGTTFAKDLAIKLHTTHPWIHVGGYSKSIFHVQGMRAVTDPDGPNTTGSGLVWWFDGSGKRVAKPVLPKWALNDETAAFNVYDPMFPTK